VSWDEEFASKYEEWSAGMTADVPFYVGLAADADGPLVELAIGDGRVAIPVARATGRTVIGIDSSSTMLEQASAAAAEAGVSLDLRPGDMRDLELDELAGLIYCPYRALLHLPTWADRGVRSSASRPRFVQMVGSRGTPLRLTITSRRAWTDGTKTSPSSSCSRAPLPRASRGQPS